MFGRMAR